MSEPSIAEPLRPRSPATMRQVAAHAGVALKTVSRVLNKEQYVSEETTQKVMRAVHELDYHLDMQAGSLRRRGTRTRTLGLLVSSVDNPFASALHRAIEDAAFKRGVSVLASSLDDDPSREEAAVKSFLRRRVDGLILTSVRRHQAYLTGTIERGTPVVYVDRDVPFGDVDVIVSDNEGGAATAAAHLLAHGHHRIAFVGDRLGIPTAAARLEGFARELGRAGVPSEELLVVTELHDEASAEQAVGALLAGANPPTAVFSAQNLVTAGAVRAIRLARKEREIALVGFDDFPFADLLDPGITVVAQDPAAMGRLAARTIFRRLDGETDTPRRVTLPTTLIARGSGEIAPASLNPSSGRFRSW